MRSFRAGSGKKASAAADVNEDAPDGPPGGCGFPGRSVASQPKHGGKAGLAEEHEENALWKEEKRGSPRSCPREICLAASDFLRRV